MKSQHDLSFSCQGDTYLFTTDTPQEHVDAVVWNAFKSGDRKALDYIFNKYVKLLYAYGGKITKDQDLVEDCIQDLFVELWQRRHSLSEVTHIKYYLLKSLRRRVARKLSSDKGVVVGDMEVIEQDAGVEFPNRLTISLSSITMCFSQKPPAFSKQQRVTKRL